MRVWDAESAIYDGLRALPRRRYLCAMWILADQLRGLFESRLSGSERSLMGTTLNMLRTVVIAREEATETAGRAAELKARWQSLIAERENDVLPGQWNTWATFESLAGELAGTKGQYDATERLTLAATERWREPYPGKARRINPSEEIDDLSPMAQTLAMFEQIVSGVARAAEGDLDPSVLRTQLLGR